MHTTEKYPLISIIVPVYNNQDQVVGCLESIKNQTYTTIEVLIIDDGSTDYSKQVCREFCKKDKRFNFYSIEHSGVACARNYGIEYSRGKYIGFVDADDTIDKYMYEDLYNYMKNNNADVAICSYKIIQHDKECKIVSSNYNGRIELDKNLDFSKIGYSACNKLFKKSFIKKNNILFPLIKVGEDANFVLSYFLATNVAYYIKKPYYNYVFNAQSATHIVDIDEAITNYSYNLNSLKNTVEKHKNDYTNLLLYYYESIVNIVYVLLNILVLDNVKIKDAIKYEKRILNFLILYKLPYSFSSKSLHKKIMLHFAHHKLYRVLYLYISFIKWLSKFFRK